MCISMASRPAVLQQNRGNIIVFSVLFCPFFFGLDFYLYVYSHAHKRGERRERERGKRET